MSIISDSLTYVNDSYTQAEISRITGIPSSTISYVIRGIRELPAKYNKAVTSLKSTLAYTNLFNAGVPSLQASLLALEPVSSIHDTESYVKNVANNLTMGYLEKLAIDENDGIIDQLFIDDNYSRAYNSITESLKRSTKPISEWKDYIYEEPGTV